MAWNEGDHPRGAGGKFGSGGSAGAGKASPATKGGGEVKGLKNHPLDKMRDYTPTELDWEYGTEYEKYSKSFAPDAFSSREDFQKKYDATPLTTLSDKEFHDLENTTGLSGIATFNAPEAGKIKHVKSIIGARRDVNRIIDDMDNGKTAPPIILKKDGELRLMAGNTRLITAAAKGINLPVKVMDVSEKPKAQDTIQIMTFDGPLPHNFGNVKEATLFASKLDRALLGPYAKGGPPVIASDKQSVRTYTKDGLLHIDVSHISKANVCPYVGKEIPNYEKLGLDGEKIYYLFRSPEELEKGAHTFNGLPVLIEHEPTSAADHKKDLVIGATMNDAKFNAPYLDNAISIWPQAAIDGIENDEQREISCGYYYTPDMTPGEFEGQKYDGIMRDIVGNHVAIVTEGRAGKDVVVMDNKPKGIDDMAKGVKKAPLQSRTALRVQGALQGLFLPKLAADAKIDWAKFTVGVTAKNLKAKRAEIIKLAKDGIEEALNPAAAAAGGAGPDDVIMRVLDLVDSQVAPAAAGGMPGEMEADTAALAPSAAPAMPKPAAGGDDKTAKLMAMLQGKLAPDDMTAVQQLMGGEPATDPDASQDEDPDADPVDADDEDPKAPKGVDEDPDMADKITKGAMDKAIAASGAAMTKRFRDARAAEMAVRPYIGEIKVAMDSAGDIYRLAFDALKVDVKDVPEAAYPAMLKLVPVPGEKKTVTAKAPIAADAAHLKSFAERFPGADKIKHA